MRSSFSHPCGISLAATFNREAAKGVGTGIGSASDILLEETIELNK